MNDHAKFTNKMLQTAVMLVFHKLQSTKCRKHYFTVTAVSGSNVLIFAQIIYVTKDVIRRDNVVVIDAIKSAVW